MSIQPSTRQKFPLVMRLLHWSMALMIFAMLGLGIYMAGLPMEDTDKFALYDWHRAFGVLVFFLVLVRLVVKFKTQQPELPESLPGHEKFIARLVQIGIYLAMISIVVTGYVASSAVPDFPGFKAMTGIWFFFTELPLAPVEKNYDVTKFVIGIHAYIAYVFIGALVLHIAGALKHRYFDKAEHDVLKTML